MKKAISAILGLMAICLFSGHLTSCSPLTPYSEAIIGRWNLESETIGGIEKVYNGSKYWVFDKNYIKAYDSNDPGNNNTLPYYIEGDDIYVENIAQWEIETLNGSRLVLESETENIEHHLYFRKR